MLRPLSNQTTAVPSLSECHCGAASMPASSATAIARRNQAGSASRRRVVPAAGRSTPSHGNSAATARRRPRVPWRWIHQIVAASRGADNSQPGDTNSSIVRPRPDDAVEQYLLPGLRDVGARVADRVPFAVSLQTGAVLVEP